jgi:hypothetical protein
MIKIYDLTGSERNWSWVASLYGGVEVKPADAGQAAYRLVELREGVGAAIYLAGVRDAAGGPAAGVRVVRTWPGAPSLPGEPWLRQHGPNGVFGLTDEGGQVGFGGGGGDYYDPGQAPGPTAIWVGDGPSDRVQGLGFLPLTEHQRLDPVFQWVETQPEPAEPPEPPGPPAEEDELGTLVAALIRLLGELIGAATAALESLLAVRRRLG